MSVLDPLLGRPLAPDEARSEQIGPLVGVPVLVLDALSSGAYRPEAALTPLIPLSSADQIAVISRIVRPVLSEGLTATLRHREQTTYNWACFELNGSASESGVE
jgi:uncharacterized protein (UPF0261 family)